LETVKNLISFLSCLALSVGLAYLISGSGGIFIAVLLIMATITSLALLALSHSTIDISMGLSGNIVNKGDELTARLDFNKKFFFPSSFIEVTLAVTPNIEGEDGSLAYRFICTGLRGDSIEIPLKARLCGGAEVSVEKITFTDYLGMFRMKKKKLPEMCKVKILPRIPDTGSQNEVLRSVSQNISFDDSDEESNETSSALTGVPGYEHRAYVPGDPLKRVNWKLSSKKDQLMVRLDEKVTSSSQIFRMDLPTSPTPDLISYTMMDITIEGSLAMLSMLIRSGYESEYNYFIDGNWEMAEIGDEASLIQLQERLAGITPYPDERRMVDHDINEKGKSMICFTACTGQMTDQLADLMEKFEGTLVVVKESGLGAIRNDMWTVSREFEFEKLT
jgi:uncharacterized protein (DUF58 family)